jgi:hypothetical protein
MIVREEKWLVALLDWVEDRDEHLAHVLTRCEFKVKRKPFALVIRGEAGALIELRKQFRMVKAGWGEVSHSEPILRLEESRRVGR